MTLWLNHVAIAAPRTGSSSHTVTPSSAGGGTVAAGALFAPTAGRLLLCFVEGAVTSSTPAGWALPAGGSAVNNTGLYLFTKTAAGNDSLTTSHNGSNYPLVFHFLEFPAGSTLKGVVSSTGNSYSAGAGPTLTGLTGTNLQLFIAGQALADANTYAGSWSVGTELVDLSVPKATTEGYTYGLAYVEDSTAATASSAWTSTNAGFSTERLVAAVNVATSGSGSSQSIAAPSATSSAAARSAVAVGMAVLAVTAAATAGAGVPAVSAGVTISAPTAAALAAAPSPQVAAAVSLAPAAAPSTASATIPTVAALRAVSVPAPAAPSSAAAAAPAVTAGTSSSVSLAPPSAASVAAAASPTVSSGVSLRPAAGGSTAAAATPVVSAAAAAPVNLTPPSAAAVGAAGTPGLSVGVLVVPASASSTSAAMAPTLAAGWQVRAPSAPAVVVGGHPTVAAAVSVAAPSATSIASATPPRLGGDAPVLRRPALELDDLSRETTLDASAPRLTLTPVTRTMELT